MSWREGIFMTDPSRSSPQDKGQMFFQNRGFKPVSDVMPPIDLPVDMLFDHTNCTRIIGDWNAVACCFNGDPHYSEVKRLYDEALKIVLERNHVKCLQWYYRGSMSQKFLEECEAELRMYVEP
jgi:hypothetical protein